MRRDRIKSGFIAGPCMQKANLWKYGTISRFGYGEYISGIAKIIAKRFENIEIIPDEGVPLDIAKAVQQLPDRPQITGYFPKHAMSEHLEKNYSYCDKITGLDGDWINLNTVPSSFSGVLLCFGLSTGVFQEISYTKIHKVCNNIDVKVLIDERAISNRLNPELEFETNITYFDSNKMLRFILKKLAIEKCDR